MFLGQGGEQQEQGLPMGVLWLGNWETWDQNQIQLLLFCKTVIPLLAFVFKTSILWERETVCAVNYMWGLNLFAGSCVLVRLKRVGQGCFAWGWVATLLWMVYTWRTQLCTGSFHGFVFRVQTITHDNTHKHKTTEIMHWKHMFFTFPSFLSLASST